MTIKITVKCLTPKIISLYKCIFTLLIYDIYCVKSKSLYDGFILTILNQEILDPYN